jgi:glycine hydroxymethyltransferase
MNLDCHSIRGSGGVPLSGDQAARLLDIAGIVVNRNTIPGDKSAANPAGIRMGTPWVTQRGFKEPEMVQLADIIADLLQATTPYIQIDRAGSAERAKVDFGVLEKAKIRVRILAEGAGIDFAPSRHGYPHYFFIDDLPPVETSQVAYDLHGDRVREFLNFTLSSDVEALKPGQSQRTCLVTPEGEIDGIVTCSGPFEFSLSVPVAQASLAGSWLRDLSDGYVSFDREPLRKLPGPVGVSLVGKSEIDQPGGDPVEANKPYFIGVGKLATKKTGLSSLPAFQWDERELPLRRTPMFETHKRLGARLIPFAGWEMPVWYSSVIEEHQATRQAAGLFDVAHMGVYQAEGSDAAAFLDSVVGNDGIPSREGKVPGCSQCFQR